MLSPHLQRHLKNYLILAGYLVFFVFIPWGIVHFSDDEHVPTWVEYIALYSLFVPPFLFIVPYKLAKLYSKKEKALYFLLGFVIPFALFYYYIYLDYQANFHPLSF